MDSIKIPVFQASQIREFEHLASEKFGIDSKTLMQRAGKAVYDFLLRRWPQAKRISIFCGGGNNGGDGYIAAQLAAERGLDVTIYQVGNHADLPDEARSTLQNCQKAQIEILTFDEKVDLQHPDVIVDALLGIGLKGDVKPEFAAAIEKMQRSHSPILAIDMPSGVDADTGCIFKTALHAQATITFIGYKPGLLTGSGIACAGDLVLNDLQLPSDLFSMVKPAAEKVQLNCYASYLKARSRDWHKGLSGHVVVIGGEIGYSGAPRMAGEAALRTGAGLVSIATRPENALTMNIYRPELMCHGTLNTSAIKPLLDKADVIVIGPGLGQSDWAKSLWGTVLQYDTPMIVDADGLNLLAKSLYKKDNWILTPHPGEAARLLNTSTQEVQADRLQACKKINDRYGGTCVLKGAGSLISTAGKLPAVCDKGNPGMASGGMGDVLSGVIGGLIAQSIPLEDSAKMGVCLHAAAGDIAAKEGERGMLAMDLMPFLRRLVNQIN